MKNILICLSLFDGLESLNLPDTVQMLFVSVQTFPIIACRSCYPRSGAFFPLVERASDTEGLVGPRLEVSSLGLIGIHLHFFRFSIKVNFDVPERFIWDGFSERKFLL